MNKSLQIVLGSVALVAVICVLAANAGPLSEEERQLLASRKTVQMGSNFFANKIAENEKQIEPEMYHFKKNRKVFEDKILKGGPIPVPTNENGLAREGDDISDVFVPEIVEVFQDTTSEHPLIL